ncbi:hypothetical protein [Paenibacillus daejeonensis]|uniref:hypothetical protein n=1 Tax=Paenibacillus daejeonensis TaxID=135193 RepID=UPI00036FF28A|nr:hypothetical protein [Paenibacillus daejeonensis]
MKIGRFIEHVDFLSIFQWLSGAYIRIALAIYLSLELWNLQQLKHRVIATFLISGFLLLGTVVRSARTSIELFLQQLQFPVSLTISLALTCFLGLFLLLFRHGKDEPL